MLAFLLWYHVLFLATEYVTTDLVQLEQGLLNGTLRTARNGKKFKAFYGIPYARAPVAELRFKPPEEAEPWSGVLQANRSSPACIQLNRTAQSVTGQEDCLYLNIFTPLTAEAGDNIPVMVFIHGGGYNDGSNEREAPDYIMGFNVILIQINYRLGVFGFLSTGDTVIPGNMGLKDQVMALKWTRRNIYEFGGDADRVTLAGHSSGADNVHMHTFSPLSVGLFQRIIILSGSGVGVISFHHPEMAAGVTHLIAEIVGCKGNSSWAIFECFSQANAKDLVIASSQLQMMRMRVAPLLRPVIESKEVEDAFIIQFPDTNAYTSKSIPWIIGHTSNEGATIAAKTLMADQQLHRTLTKEYMLSWPILMGYVWTAKPSYIDQITKVYKNHYLGKDDIGSSTAQKVVRMMSDVYFNAPIYEALSSYSGPRYVYLYEYRSNFSTQMNISGYKKFLGVSHVDDLQILFKRKESCNLLTKQDVIFGDEILKRWVNFMYTGNPNKPFLINGRLLRYWRPVVSDRIEYLRIKVNGSMDTDYDRTGYDLSRSVPLFSNFIP